MESGTNRQALPVLAHCDSDRTGGEGTRNSSISRFRVRAEVFARCESRSAAGACENALPWRRNPRSPLLPGSIAAGASCRKGAGRRRGRCSSRRSGAEETPEAFEGLSWAAWWLDDAEAVFAARERAYHLYKDAGDVAGAARMATWLACDQLDFHGAFAVAGGWLGRAHRLLDPLEPGPEHGWLAFFEGYMAHAGGETAKAAELGRRAAELGRRFDVPDLEMLGLALEGATLVACAQVEEGMRCLDEATATALQGEATVPISGAWACCFLVTACTAVRDYERAFEWCDRIAEFAERYGSRYMLAFCRAEYGAVHLWRGRWDAGGSDARGLDRGLRSIAPGDGRGAAGGAGGTEAPAGPVGRGRSAARPRRSVLEGAALPRSVGARPRGRRPSGRARRALPAPGARGPRARPRRGA